MVVCAERLRRRPVKAILAGSTPVHHPRPIAFDFYFFFWYTLLQRKIKNLHFSIQGGIVKSLSTALLGGAIGWIFAGTFFQQPTTIHTVDGVVLIILLVSSGLLSLFAD